VPTHLLAQLHQQAVDLRLADGRLAAALAYVMQLAACGCRRQQLLGAVQQQQQQQQWQQQQWQRGWVGGVCAWCGGVQPSAQARHKRSQ
jgi:hypothetical protein